MRQERDSLNSKLLDQSRELEDRTFELENLLNKPSPERDDMGTGSSMNVTGVHNMERGTVMSFNAADKGTAMSMR